MSKATRLQQARNRLPDALIVLGELRRAIELGQGVHRLLEHVEELQELLAGVEDAVGARAPASLFQEALDDPQPRR